MGLVSAICRREFGKRRRGKGRAYSAGYAVDVVAPLVSEPAHDVEECSEAEGERNGRHAGEQEAGHRADDDGGGEEEKGRGGCRERDLDGIERCREAV